MTNKEIDIIYLLQNIYEQYCSLDEQHDSDIKEFIEALHKLQHLIMIRSVRRKHPDLFPIKVKTITEADIKKLENIISSELNKQILGD